MNGQPDNESTPKPVNPEIHEGAQQISIPVTNASNAQTQSAPVTTEYANDVKNFFSKNLLQIVKDIFTQPIKGTRGLFENAGSEAYQHGLILIVTTIIFYTLIPYMMVGRYVRSAAGIGTFFKLGLSAGLVLLIISAITFGIKSISGKPDFKKEFLTGGICGIPLILVIVFTGVLMLFNEGNMNFMNPASMINQGIISGIIFLYLVLMLFNIVQQSFKASGTNDGLSWYLSPLVICAGFYIGVKIAASLFGPGSSSFSPYGY